MLSEFKVALLLTASIHYRLHPTDQPTNRPTNQPLSGLFSLESLSLVTLTT